MSGSTVSSLLRSESAHYESWQSRINEWIVSELSHFLLAQLNILPIRLGDGEKRISGYYRGGAAPTSPQIELPDNNHAGDDLRCHS